MINLHYKEIDILEDVYFYNLKSSASPLLSIYYDQTELWTLLHNSITNTFLIKLMVFNLHFNISPVHVFIKYYQEELMQLNLNRFDKQCIGYHIAFIFKSLGYQETRQIYRRDAIIKYGGYYELIEKEDCIEEDNELFEAIMEIVETYLKHRGIKKVAKNAITSPKKRANIFRQMFGSNSQECMGIICIDTKGHPTHYSTAYKGTLNQTTISPKDILKKLHYYVMQHQSYYDTIIQIMIYPPHHMI